MCLLVLSSLLHLPLYTSPLLLSLSLSPSLPHLPPPSASPTASPDSRLPVCLWTWSSKLPARPASPNPDSGPGHRQQLRSISWKHLETTYSDTDVFLVWLLMIYGNFGLRNSSLFLATWGGDFVVVLDRQTICFILTAKWGDSAELRLIFFFFSFVKVRMWWIWKQDCDGNMS